MNSIQHSLHDVEQKSERRMLDAMAAEAVLDSFFMLSPVCPLRRAFSQGSFGTGLGISPAHFMQDRAVATRALLDAIEKEVPKL